MTLLWITHAGVMELADVTDSKSVDGDIVWVRVPPPAPAKKQGKALPFLSVPRLGEKPHASCRTVTETYTLGAACTAEGEQSEARRGSESHHRHQQKRQGKALPFLPVPRLGEKPHASCRTVTEMYTLGAACTAEGEQSEARRKGLFRFSVLFCKELLHGHAQDLGDDVDLPIRGTAHLAF